MEDVISEPPKHIKYNYKQQFFLFYLFNCYDGSNYSFLR